MTYLVTGATSYIGKRLARRLLADGHKVRVLTRKPKSLASLEKRGAQVFSGSVTDRDSLKPAMEGVDGVFHTASWFGIGRSNPAGERLNLEGTRNVLEVAGDLKVFKIVYTSTIAIYGDTRGQLVDENYFYNGAELGWASAFDRSMWKAYYEVALPQAESGLPLVTVLPGLVFGPGDPSAIGSLLRDLLQDRPLLFLPADTVYCWSHIDDTVEAHVLAMEWGMPGEAYNISGEPATLVEVMQRAREIAGSRSQLVPVPAPLLKAASYLVRPFDSKLPPRYTSEALRLASVSYTASNRKARTQLGFSPRSIDAGLPSTISALREALKRSSQ